MASTNTTDAQTSLKLLEGPHILIENSPEGILTMNKEGMEHLAMLDKPCVVVSIAGLYRTGKSYILNRLAGYSRGE